MYFKSILSYCLIQVWCPLILVISFVCSHLKYTLLKCRLYNHMLLFGKFPNKINLVLFITDMDLWYGRKEIFRYTPKQMVWNQDWTEATHQAKSKFRLMFEGTTLSNWFSYFLSVSFEYTFWPFYLRWSLNHLYFSHREFSKYKAFDLLLK